MCMNPAGMDMEQHVEAAIEAFRNGNPVCLFDAETGKERPTYSSQVSLLRLLR